MGAARGVLVLLRALSEGPASRRQLEEALAEAGIVRDERTVRRWLEVLREEGFEIERTAGRYELRGSPIRLAFDEYEALAALSVLESLAEREPVYGERLGSAAGKLRAALPTRLLKFVDRGRIEFELSSASDPPEDPNVIDVLRQSAHRNQRVKILYYSLRSGTLSWRALEPVRVYHAQKAHRLYAYDPDANEYREFRISRVREARMLPDKFSPEAHVRQLKPVKIWLDQKSYTAYGRSIIPDPHARVESLDGGEAIIEGATPSTFWTVREIAALGPGAKILGGTELKEEFLSFLRETLEKYE
ncbi:MAG: WYL domain-containing protein [Actinomycetota bacterium]